MPEISSGNHPGLTKIRQKLARHGIQHLAARNGVENGVKERTAERRRASLEERQRDTRAGGKDEKLNGRRRELLGN
jgi:hypothetical protein